MIPTLLALFLLAGTSVPTKVPPCPKTGEPARFYPEHAWRNGIEGRVVLQCTVGRSQKLEKCSVISEDPAGEGFAIAALGIVRCSAPVDGKPGEVRTVPIRFEPPPPEPDAPEWVRRPTGADMASVYPDAAVRAGIQGRVIMQCIVGDNGEMTNCQIAKEEPEGLGFGKAALKLSGAFQITPTTKAGVSVRGKTLTIPITFRARPD